MLSHTSFHREGYEAARRRTSPPEAYDAATDTSSGKRLFFLGLIASLVLTAAIAIGVLLFGEFDDTEARILATTGLLALFSLVALPGGVLIDRREHVWLAYVTIGLAAAAFAVAMAGLWGRFGGEREEDLWTAAVVLGAFAGASAQVATTTARLRVDDPPVVRLLYAGSVVLGVLLATLVSVLVVEEVESSGFLRVLGAVAVADVLLVVIQSVARRARGPAPTPDGEAAVVVRGPADAIEAAIPDLERRGLRVSRRAS